MNKEIFKTVVASGIVLLICAFIILRYEGFFYVINLLVRTLRPVISGLAAAFIINRPLGKIDSFYKGFYLKRGRAVSEKPLKISVFSIYIIVLLLLGGIIGIIVPQLINNVNVLIDNFDDYYKNFERIYNNVSQYMQVEWLKNFDIMGQINSLADYIPDIIVRTFGVTADILDCIIDFIVGMVLSVYIVSDKVHLKQQSRLILKKFFKKNIYDKIIHYSGIASEAFSNFISGQLTESLIMGVLCFAGMTVFQFEYSLLISVIIGITNIIPIAGPILGTIPCAFILLLIEPRQALWFVVFIIILQQIESNFIYPKVVGTSVGLPAMWVLIAVITGGGLYGVAGMIIFIPLTSMIYNILRENVRN